MLADLCKAIETSAAIPNNDIFEDFGLLTGNPWQNVVDSDITSYYSCLFQIVVQEKAEKILEIGTAFGMSAATMIKASPDIDLFVSMDLGIFGEQYGFSQNNIDYVRTRIHTWCCKNGVPFDRVRFYEVNSQPAGTGDNDDIGTEVPRWTRIPDLIRLFTCYEFDVIFVDGKHTGDGLLNDLITVWPFLKEGGLLICDDLHDEKIYKDVFPWAGQTLRSFNTFTGMKSEEIEDSFIWNFPKVIPGDYTGLRPFGLIRKKSQPIVINVKQGSEVFDTPEALEINRARQDHLASLGLDLERKTVLEVGSGVGRHTAFFEKLGCTCTFN